MDSYACQSIDIPLVKSRVKHSWAFSNLVSIIRQQLMNYIDIYSFVYIYSARFVIIVLRAKELLKFLLVESLNVTKYDEVE